MIIIGILILTYLSESLQICSIKYPDPTKPFSSKLSIRTNHRRENFIDFVSYIPRKTYDVTVIVNGYRTLVIDKVYVLVKNIKDNTNVGDILVNSSGILDLQHCLGGFEAKLCCNSSKEFTFYWTAPRTTDNCVQLSVIVQVKSQSFTDIEGYKREICESRSEIHDAMLADQQNENSCARKVKPSMVKPCNIGSTALYRIEIENIWNHLNHWKDWPGRDGYVPKLTQYTGASHSADYNIYHMGGQASDAVRQLCTNGSSTALENQFFKAENNILTIILARSLEATSKSAKRSALVEVNTTHHLISFLSHLVPSPDWCTGLSRYDLCSGQCSWPQKVTVFLYPWDAGVYMGESYLSSKDVETRASVICPITSQWPKDNPFTKIGDKVQHIGSVTFKLLQEYNKKQRSFCTPGNATPQNDGTKHGDNPCYYSEWSRWGPCSSTCGQGQRVRYRTIKGGTPETCMDHLSKESENCYQKCTKQSSNESCQKEVWSDWSQCNATCAHPGIISRTRLYNNEDEIRKCSGMSDSKQMETCHLSALRCLPRSVCNAAVRYKSSCGWPNTQLRYYFHSSTGTCRSFQGCLEGINNFLSESDCETMCRSYFRNKLLQATDNNEPLCEIPLKDNRNCKRKFFPNRWHFDAKKHSCYMIHIWKCEGDATGFITKELCKRQCLTDAKTVRIEPPNFYCIYSKWSNWSDCLENCSLYRTRTRVLISPKGECTDKLIESEKCQWRPCVTKSPRSSTTQRCQYSPWSSWSMCSVSCGNGFRERVRVRLNYDCNHESSLSNQREACFIDC